MKIDREINYIDDIYEFNGRLGIPSTCGLKIAHNADNYVVIVTELYGENPGSSITDCCDIIATKLYKESQLRDHSKFTYIEHAPEVNSKLSFYDETFNIVNFKWNGECFENPVWTEIEKKEIIKLLSKA